MLQKVAFGFGFETWKRGRSAESGEGRESLYIGEMTPVLAIDHLRFLEASHLTTREDGDDPCPGSDAEAFPGSRERGGNNLATQRSPCGEGVKR